MALIRGLIISAWLTIIVLTVTVDSFDCYYSADSGASYRGSVATTVNKRNCQRWSSQSPHWHTRTPEHYGRLRLVNNFCRNPDGEPRPWCYTTDPNVRWEYCSIPPCQGQGCYELSNSGSRYRGNVSATKSGKMCQSWSSQHPHIHSRTPTNYPNSGLISNYCRNPDGDSAPWCFTTVLGSRWEYCPVEVCAGCYRTFDSGTSYRGGVARTENGRECQKWRSQLPHEHSRTRGSYRRSGLEKNYCRNPDGEDRPWCYTTDPDKRWEYCSIATC